MSELSNRPVANGERVQVSSAVFTGTAGVVRTAAGGEFAFYGGGSRVRRGRSGNDAALAVLGVGLKNPAAVVDGRDCTILDLRKSDVATDMLIARFEYAETE